MPITVNEAPTTLTAPCSLQQLVETLELNPNGLALAVNQKIVAKSQWAETLLTEHDDVSAFQIVTGG
ncbi:sulfur carrier protein ThiS [Alkalimonas delamerensis]|uniref:Sulfur carrier protein ThiS n=1 Tax=Alkalimonas delamerensis TaxID=265981 RepID=A0ABT9GPB1_9GAMM|nr:sulfur carrier protein ThiS [Alkalimonas delamerensis]MDP4528793.1 sulfur carrier protein ThiS [Alkalimonas delamerensis]